MRFPREEEGRWAYESARLPMWIDWDDLPGYTRREWCQAAHGAFLAARRSSGPVVGIEAKNGRDGSTRSPGAVSPPPRPETAVADRYQAGTDPDPAGTLAASLGIPAS